MTSYEANLITLQHRLPFVKSIARRKKNAGNQYHIFLHLLHRLSSSCSTGWRYYYGHHYCRRCHATGAADTGATASSIVSLDKPTHCLPGYPPHCSEKV